MEGFSSAQLEIQAWKLRDAGCKENLLPRSWNANVERDGEADLRAKVA
jgi:hypothetical protein